MRKPKATQRPGKPVAARITESLTAAVKALESGKKLSDVFRVDVIEIPDPPRYTSTKVKGLRQRLRVTQGIFAKLLGVSIELVEGWEQGIRVPHPMACRLMNEIEGDPPGFMARLKRRAA